MGDRRLMAAVKTDGTFLLSRGWQIWEGLTPREIWRPAPTDLAVMLTLFGKERPGEQVRACVEKGGALCSPGDLSISWRPDLSEEEYEMVLVKHDLGELDRAEEVERLWCAVARQQRELDPVQIPREYVCVGSAVKKTVTVLCATDYGMDKVDEVLESLRGALCWDEGPRSGDVDIKAVAVEGPFADDEMVRLWFSLRGTCTPLQRRKAWRKQLMIGAIPCWTRSVSTEPRWWWVSDRLVPCFLGLPTPSSCTPSSQRPSSP